MADDSESKSNVRFDNTRKDMFNDSVVQHNHKGDFFSMNNNFSPFQSTFAPNPNHIEPKKMNETNILNTPETCIKCKTKFSKDKQCKLVYCEEEICENCNIKIESKYQDLCGEHVTLSKKIEKLNNYFSSDEMDRVLREIAINDSRHLSLKLSQGKMHRNVMIFISISVFFYYIFSIFSLYIDIVFTLMAGLLFIRSLISWLDILADDPQLYLSSLISSGRLNSNIQFKVNKIVINKRVKTKFFGLDNYEFISNIDFESQTIFFRNGLYERINIVGYRNSEKTT